MTPRFCPQFMLNSALILAIGSFGVAASVRQDVQAKQPDQELSQAAASWRWMQNEVALLYLSYPHLNPLEQPRLRDYARRAHDQITRLSETLRAAVYLISNSEESLVSQPARRGAVR